MGPAAPPSDLEPTLDMEDTPQSAPVSPYTATRTQIRNLTMPPVPNFDIPPSPPGSPSPAATKKIAHFLALKSKGTHFNERLLQSSALRNPGLLHKLMDFAGIKEDEQYESSLPDGVKVRTKIQKWEYVDALMEAHEKIRKGDDGSVKKRERLEFVNGGKEDGERAPQKKKSRFDR